MIDLNLNLTLTMWDDSTRTATARITPETDKQGNRIYQADLPIFYNDKGEVLLVKSCHVDKLPGHSVLVLALDTEDDDG